MAILTAMPSAAQVVVASIAAPAIVAVPDAGNTITLPAETEIWLAPLRDISSKHVRQGQPITMQVSRDVFVHRVLVIPRGAEATGRISYRTGKGALGKSAKIEFDLLSLTVAHQPVPITGHYRVAGDGNSAWAVATFMLVSMVGSLFITGHSAVVPAGSEWRATTAAPLQIALDGDDVPFRAGFRLASATRMSPLRPRQAVPVERDYPADSAYIPPPAEIFVHTLPPRP